MRVYLAGPNDALKAQAAVGMPVLVSFAYYPKGNKISPPWLDEYVPAFSHLLVDSGAYSVLNSGTEIDGTAYKDWHQRFAGHADAIAGLDDIEGDWQKSLANYAAYGGFPTFHDTDPSELLDELIGMAQERGGWLGIGLRPPRSGKARFLQATLDRIPDSIHVHGWALRAYTRLRRFDSVDSTNWFRDAFKLKTNPLTCHLTYGECLEIVVKRYVRWDRLIDNSSRHPSLFDGEDDE